MKRLLLFSVFLAVVLLVIPMDGEAQCAMCRASVESNIKEGNGVGAGLNAGILYLMSIPYIILSVIGYFWYKSSRTVRA